MRIILTNHARDRMAQRGVSRADIEAALRDVQLSVRTSRGATYVGRAPNGRELKVVLKPPGMGRAPLD